MRLATLDGELAPLLMLTYPVVEIPRAITAALNARPFPLAPPVPASLPLLPPPARLSGAAGLCLGGLGLLSLTLVILLLPALAWAAALLTGLSWWWAGRRATRRHRQAKQAYDTSFAQYLAYPAHQAAYEQAHAAMAQPDVVARYRAQRVAGALATTQPFERIPAGEFIPPAGASEAFLAHHLRQEFGAEHFFLRCRVRVDEAFSGPSWYYPDIVYAMAGGLRIDIEIDEPYVWTTGEPHHYLGQDDARNAFFLRQGWVVLRFSEEQVARYPLQCCQQLAELLYQLTGQHHPLRSYCEQLAPYPRWDWATAQRLAARRSRASYQATLQPPPEREADKEVGR